MSSIPRVAFKHLLADHVAKIQSLLPGDVRHEICRQPELVGALKSRRFRGAFLPEVVLPIRVAESLKEFEAGLRDAGFVAADEVCRQSLDRGFHFRMQKVSASDDHAQTPRRKAIIDRREIYARLNAKTSPALPHSAVGAGIERPPASLVARRNRS